MANRFKDAAPTLCLVTGVFALIFYTVMFSVAWGFYDQGYPNGIPVRNAALVSTVPLVFIVAICLTCTLTVCGKNVWHECCLDGDNQTPHSVFWLVLLSPAFMVLAGVFALVGVTLFAILAATFVPKEDLTNLFEVHLFCAAASVFGLLTGLCCCGAVFCCCAMREDKVQGQLLKIQGQTMKHIKQQSETTM